LWAGNAYALRNNLNLIQPARTHFGLGFVQGDTLRVRLLRTRAYGMLFYNNGDLIITDIPSGGPPLFDGSEAGLPFDEAFPNGAYELRDQSSAMLLAAKGCLQGKAPDNEGWDNSRMYCDKASVAAIQISTYKGDDTVYIDPAITVPVTSRCPNQQDPCGYSCYASDERTCCDQTGNGCWIPQGQTCGAAACNP